MVTHYPQLARRHSHPKVDIGGAVAGEDVGLVEQGPVDVDPAALTFNGVAPDADDALDEVALAGRGRQANERERVLYATLRRGRRGSGGEPAGGVAEHHDVAEVQATQVGGRLVDEHLSPAQPEHP